MQCLMMNQNIMGLVPVVVQKAILLSK